MAVIDNFTVPNSVKGNLDIYECKGYWTPEGYLNYGCGLTVGMEWALKSAYFWGGALMCAHEEHHKHMDPQVSGPIKSWALVETITCEGPMASISFDCGCEAL